MKDIVLIGKKIFFDKSRIILKSLPDENWEKDWMVMGGEWKMQDGCLIGKETGNKGGILFTRESFDKDVMMSFTASTVLPATRDMNAVFCAHWDEVTDYLGVSYVCGLNGWYNGKSGIESNSAGGFCALTSSYSYTPGKEVRMTVGAVDGHTFMVVDGELVMEYIDPAPIRGGHLGFSPYCTMMKIRDIEVREICWEKFIQSYEPEF